MLYRARLLSYDEANHQADVELLDGPACRLTLPVLENCPAYHLAGDDDLAVQLWADVGGLVLGPYGGVPGDAELPGDLDLGGALGLAGAIESAPSALTRYWLSEVADIALADDTYVDVLTLTKGIAAYSTNRGLFSALLWLQFNGRTGSGSARMLQRLYSLTCWSFGGVAMSGALEQLGSDQGYNSGSVTATVQIKSGASETALTIEAKATWSSWGSGATLGAWLVGVSQATSSQHVITPSMA